MRGAVGAARALRSRCSVVHLPSGRDRGTLLEPEVGGALLLTSSDELRAFLRSQPFPVINLSNSYGLQAEMGNLLSDDRAVGRMAADYLIARGYRHFLALSGKSIPVHEERAEGFCRRLAERGFPFSREHVELRYPDQVSSSPARYFAFMREQVDRPIGSVPLGSGIFATNDEIALFIQQALAALYPEHRDTSGVLGVDNAAADLGYFGHLSALSSVVPAFEEMGRVGMEWLLKHPGQEGKALVGDLHRRFPPVRVIERASTVTGACADPLTARVIRWTWEQIRGGDKVRVADMARAHNLNRKTLERRFSEFTESTPGDLIARFRLDKARDLLRSTNLSIAEISESCGYAKQDVLSRALRRESGLTPMEFRRREGGAGECS